MALLRTKPKHVANMIAEQLRYDIKIAIGDEINRVFKEELVKLIEEKTSELITQISVHERFSDMSQTIEVNIKGIK